MAVLELATIITPLKHNFLHIHFVVSVILHLGANLFYLFIICLFIYIYIYLCIYSFIYLFIVMLFILRCIHTFLVGFHGNRVYQMTEKVICYIMIYGCFFAASNF